LEHQQYNWTSDLEKGAQLSLGPICILSQDEVVAFREYMNENLEKGIICHFKFPTSTPTLFVKKKDGSLEMCVHYCGLD
jgi:hypothetical protein